jgi:hypothetical protein
VTPLEYARTDLLPAIRDGLDDANLVVPERQWSQVGVNVVVDCEAIIVSAGDVQLVPIDSRGGSSCGYFEQASYMFIVAYDCATVYDNDGLTIPAVMEDVSQTLELAGKVLGQIANDITASSIMTPNPWSIGYAMDGGIGVVTLQIQLTIP